MASIKVIGRKQRLFELLTSEGGNADRGKALAAGAVLGGSVLAQILLSVTAEAHNCGADQVPCTAANFNLCRERSAGDGHECIPTCQLTSIVHCVHE